MTETASRDPVKAVGDLLVREPDETWTVNPPDAVERYEETDMDTKFARDGAYIYVFQPTSTEMRSFTADYDLTDDRDVVHVQIWGVEDPPDIGEDITDVDYEERNDTQTLRRDVVSILNQYANDNQQNTPFTTIRPIDGQDYRAEQIESSGTEYVEEVYVELRGVQQSKNVESQSVFNSGFDAGWT